MTGRELCAMLAKNGALDYELMMNVNLEPVPVRNALVIPNLQYGTMAYKRIVIFDN